MCSLISHISSRRIVQIIGALPRETAGSFQEVPLNSRITPWVFNKRSNLTFICVRSLHLLRLAFEIWGSARRNYGCTVASPLAVLSGSEQWEFHIFFSDIPSSSTKTKYHGVALEAE